MEGEIEVEDVREDEGRDDYLQMYLKFVTWSIWFCTMYNKSFEVRRVFVIS